MARQLRPWLLEYVHATLCADSSWRIPPAKPLQILEPTPQHLLPYGIDPTLPNASRVVVSDGDTLMCAVLHPALCADFQSKFGTPTPSLLVITPSHLALRIRYPTSQIESLSLIARGERVTERNLFRMLELQIVDATVYIGTWMSPKQGDPKPINLRSLVLLGQRSTLLKWLFVRPEDEEDATKTRTVTEVITNHQPQASENLLEQENSESEDEDEDEDEEDESRSSFKRLLDTVYQATLEASHEAHTPARLIDLFKFPKLDLKDPNPIRTELWTSAVAKRLQHEMKEKRKTQPSSEESSTSSGVVCPPHESGYESHPTELCSETSRESTPAREVSELDEVNDTSADSAFQLLATELEHTGDDSSMLGVHSTEAVTSVKQAISDIVVASDDELNQALVVTTEDDLNAIVDHPREATATSDRCILISQSQAYLSDESTMFTPNLPSSAASDVVSISAPSQIVTISSTTSPELYERPTTGPTRHSNVLEVTDSIPRQNSVSSKSLDSITGEDEKEPTRCSSEGSQVPAASSLPQHRMTSLPSPEPISRASSSCEASTATPVEHALVTNVSHPSKSAQFLNSPSSCQQLDFVDAVCMMSPPSARIALLQSLTSHLRQATQTSPIQDTSTTFLQNLYSTKIMQRKPLK